MNYCPKCGEPLTNENVKYCPKCGSSLVKENTSEKKLSENSSKKKFSLLIVLATIAIIGIVFFITRGGGSSGCEFKKTCSFDDFDITITDIHEYNKATSIDVEFRNNTEMAYPISYSNFALIALDDTAYSSKMTGDDDSLSFESIVSNSKNKFTVYFDKIEISNIKEIRFEGVSNGSYTIKLDAQAIIEENERIAKEKADEEQRLADEKKAQEEKNLKEQNEHIAEVRKELRDNPPYIFNMFPELIEYTDYLYEDQLLLKEKGGFVLRSNEWIKSEGVAKAPWYLQNETTPWIVIEDKSILDKIDLKDVLENSPNATAVDNILIESTKYSVFKFVYKLGVDNHPSAIFIATGGADLTEPLSSY